MAERRIIIWYDNDALPGKSRLTTHRGFGTPDQALEDAKALRDAADSVEYWAFHDIVKEVTPE